MPVTVTSIMLVAALLMAVGITRLVLTMMRPAHDAWKDADAPRRTGGVAGDDF